MWIYSYRIFTSRQRQISEDLNVHGCEKNQILVRCLQELKDQNDYVLKDPLLKKEENKVFTLPHNPLCEV